MYDKIEEKTVILPPFKHFIMTVGEIPTSYVETMTYYEMLVWFTNYLGKTVIPAINENGEAVIELQNLFVELQNYVNDYFENLDVQEEINNKLDDMAESGQLTDIIAQYLGLAGMITFDTVQDMKEATNLVNGSKCRTLGFYSIKDGGGSYYKIRQITNEDVVNEIDILKVYDNSLIAEFIPENTLNIKQLGGKAEENFDNYEILKKAISLSSNIILDKGDYEITHGIIIENEITLNGNGSLLKFPSYTLNDDSNYCFRFSNVESGEIKNLKLFATADQTGIPPVGHTYQNTSNFSNRHGIDIFNSSFVTIKDLEFTNMECDVFGSAYSLDLGRNKNKNIIISDIVSNNSPMPLVFSYTGNLKVKNYFADTKLETGFGNHFLYCSMLCNDIYVNNIKLINDNYFGCAFNFLNSDSTLFANRNYNVYIDNVSGKVSELISINETDSIISNIDIELNTGNSGSYRYPIRVYNYGDTPTQISNIFINDINIKDSDYCSGLSNAFRTGASSNTCNLFINNMNTDKFYIDGTGYLNTTISNSKIKELQILVNCKNLTLNVDNCLFINNVRTYFIVIRNTSCTLNLYNNNFIASDLSMTQAVYNTSASTLVNGYGNNCYNIVNYISSGGGKSSNNNVYAVTQ